MVEVVTEEDFLQVLADVIEKILVYDWFELFQKRWRGSTCGSRYCGSGGIDMHHHNKIKP
jgi:hypothetical protein